MKWSCPRRVALVRISWSPDLAQVARAPQDTRRSRSGSRGCKRELSRLRALPSPEPGAGEANLAHAWNRVKRGGAMRGPVNRNTTPSRSILQTIASTAPGRKCGERKYRRPFVPSLNDAVECTLASSELRTASGNFTQPSRYSAGKSMTAGTCRRHRASYESQVSLRLTRCAIFALSTTPPNLGVPLLYSARRLPGAKSGELGGTYEVCRPTGRAGRGKSWRST